MGREILYGVLGFLVGGLIVGGLVLALIDPSATGSYILLVLLVPAVLCAGIGVEIGKKLNSVNFADPALIRSSYTHQSFTVNLLITFVLVLIPNWALQSLFGPNVAIGYCLVLVAGFLAWHFYKRRQA